MIVHNIWMSERIHYFIWTHSFSLFIPTMMILRVIKLYLHLHAYSCVARCGKTAMPYSRNMWRIGRYCPVQLELLQLCICTGSKFFKPPSFCSIHVFIYSVFNFNVIMTSYRIEVTRNYCSPLLHFHNCITTTLCLTLKTSWKLHAWCAANNRLYSLTLLVDITLDKFTDLEFSFILGNKAKSSS